MKEIKIKKVQLKFGTNANLNKSKKVLARGEIVINTTYNTFRVGDGVTPIKDLTERHDLSAVGDLIMNLKMDRLADVTAGKQGNYWQIVDDGKDPISGEYKYGFQWIRLEDEPDLYQQNYEGCMIQCADMQTELSAINSEVYDEDSAIAKMGGAECDMLSYEFGNYQFESKEFKKYYLDKLIEHGTGENNLKAYKGMLLFTTIDELSTVEKVKFIFGGEWEQWASKEDCGVNQFVCIANTTSIDNPPALPFFNSFVGLRTNFYLPEITTFEIDDRNRVRDYARKLFGGTWSIIDCDQETTQRWQLINSSSKNNYYVSSDTNNGYLVGSDNIGAADVITLKVVPDDGYRTPLDISDILVDGAEISNYDQATGTFMLNNPTDNVVVHINCPELRVFNITANITRGSYIGAASATELRTTIGEIIPEDGCQVPTNITVENSSYEYTSKTIDNKYIELTYIESTKAGKQFIDTKVVPNLTTKVEADVMITTYDTKYEALFGSNSSCYCLQRYETYSTYYPEVGGNTDSKTSAIQLGNARSLCILDGLNKQYTINGVTKTFATTPGTVPTDNLYIFKKSTESYFTKMKLYGIKIYLNGTDLSLDLIPVMRISDNKNGLYDKVHKKFYPNSGTGADFIAGPKVMLLKLVNPTDNVIITAECPSIYTEVNYLESTASGGQYIKTGIIGRTGISADIEFAFSTVKDDTTVLGNRKSPYYELHYNTRFYLAYATKYNYTPSVKAEANKKYHGLLTTNNTLQKLTIDDTIIYSSADSTTYNTGIDIWLFASTADGTAVAMNGAFKIYNCKLYDGDTLVRDFVPVIRISDSKPGLWDKVNKVFCINEGTGADFIVG